MKFIVLMIFLLSISACNRIKLKTATTKKVEKRGLSSVVASETKGARTVFYAEALAEKITESLIKRYKTKKNINLQIKKINQKREKLLDREFPGESILSRISLRRLVGHSRPLIDFTIKLPPIPNNIAFPFFVNKRDQTTHLVSYILKQKKQSISHIDLFLVSLKIYKDPFTALGVIGHIFDNERLYTTDRTTTLLASKMQNLLLNHKEDLMGYNYHFWAFLNISITNNGNNLLEKGFSLIFQKWYQGDLGDYSANALGIKTGELVHRYLNKPKPL